MWIVKDGDNEEIWLYKNKPLKNIKYSSFESSSDDDCCIMLESYTDEEFKIIFGIDNLTFENSPIEIEVTIKTK